MASSDAEMVPKRESTPTVSSIPQKRAATDDPTEQQQQQPQQHHLPAVPSPLNPEGRTSTPKPISTTPIPLPPIPGLTPSTTSAAATPPPVPTLAPTPAATATASEEMTPSTRDKPARTKKESFKKREAKGNLPAGSGQGGIDSSRATPDPKQKEPPPGEIGPLRYKLAPPKAADFEPSRGPVFTHHHDVVTVDGRTVEFYETTEHVKNKRNYQYTHCIADPIFPSSLYYRQTEPPPYGPHMSFEDAAGHVFFDQSGHHITTDKGFRMARANVAIREGRWYWECRITRGIVKPPSASNEGGSATNSNSNSSSAGTTSHGHVRVGFARREASLDAPVGFDAYSYGLRDVDGQKVYMSRPKDFFPPGQDIREGDVIGLEIQLPSERLQRKVLAGQYNPAVDLVDEPDSNDGTEPAPNIVRDRIPIRFKAHIYFEKIDYHTTRELEDLSNPSPVSSSSRESAEAPHPNHPVPALRTLPGSAIRVFKNGVPMGAAFENLLAFLPPASKPNTQVGAREGLDDGMLGYYPAVSVFRGGSAEVNFGPNFWFPPAGYEPTPLPLLHRSELLSSVHAAVKGDMVDTDDEVDMIGMGDTEPEVARMEEPESESAPPKGAASETKPTLQTLRAVSDRYVEQVVEDVVYDLIDEVDFWMQDGGRVPDRVGRDGKAETVGVAAGPEEIKELVQDD